MATRFGFIDESGTKDDQLVMTVSLIVLDGQFTCRSIQKAILQALYPKRVAENLSKKDKARPRLGMHYCDINDGDKLAAAQILIKENVRCYMSCYYHDGNLKAHEERFSIYKSMVRSCVLAALDDFDDLDICVAAQGGVSAYKKEFLLELKELPGQYREYRKARFRLESNAHAGIQLADFYAGAVRDFLISQHGQDYILAAAYNIIEVQIVGDIVIEGGSVIVV